MCNHPSRCSILLTIGLFVCLLSDSALSQQGRGPGRGRGRGHDERHAADHEVFHFLLENHRKIQRTVTELPNGVETLTESDHPEIADKIREHVTWMEHRILETKPIRMRDPLFAEIFRHTSKIRMKYDETERGVRVIETSDDPYVARLIQEHARVVSGFVDRGYAEAMKNHAVPDQTAVAAVPNRLSYPVIKGYGGVVALPGAVQPPRSDSRVVVDITAGSDPESLNPAFEKVARYVNLYGMAEAQSEGRASIAVVLHGDATLAVLNADAYSQRFRTEGNPNFDCLHRLHEAGVNIYVCGQSLHHKDASSDELMVFAETAVSALTAIVNLQSDGYVRIPLGN